MLSLPPISLTIKLRVLSALLLLLPLAACGPLPEAQQLPLPPPMPVPPSATTQVESEKGLSSAPKPATRTEPPSPVVLEYRDKTYRPNIRSARLFPSGQVLDPPVLQMMAPNPLQLRFDDLIPATRAYRFRYIHCNRDWTPSGLEPFEYLEGFDRTDITDYVFSSISNQRYIQYRAQIPARDQRFTKSGQYLLLVYDDDNPDEPLITRRFYVLENQVQVEAELARPGGTQERNTHQWLRFKLKTQNLQVSNPYEQIGVHVLQNGRWDNAMLDLQPQFVRNNELIYERPDQVFEAGKEWRFFSIRSLRFLTERVQALVGSVEEPAVRLFDDEVRVYQGYQFRADMNGSWFVAADEGREDETEAEYVRVEFFLPFPAPMNDGDMYIFGGLSEYRFEPPYKLEYDFDRKGYGTSLVLKQGVYNYQYAFVEKGSTVADLSVVEGNWFEAENRYEILVYFRDFNGNYDRLVGYRSLRSVN